MTYRIDGGTKVSGAHRPWNGTEAKGGAPEKAETEAQRLERETCLTCPLPTCNPDWAACPLWGLEKPRSGGGWRKRLPVPAAFHRLAQKDMTCREIAAELGVSDTTVVRWKRQLGYSRKRLK